MNDKGVPIIALTVVAQNANLEPMHSSLALQTKTVDGWIISSRDSVSPPLGEGINAVVHCSKANDATSLQLSKQQDILVLLLPENTILFPDALEKLYWALLTNPEAQFACGCSEINESTGLPKDDSKAAPPVLVRCPKSQAECPPPGEWPTDLIHGKGVLVLDNLANNEPSSFLKTILDQLKKTKPEPPAPIFDAPTIPVEKPIRQQKDSNAPPKLLLILPWMVVGGADQFNLHLVQGLYRLGWEITIVTTIPSANIWHGQFRPYAKAVYLLDRFLPPRDIPSFLHNLIASQHFDVIMPTNSELACRLLPAIRHLAPETPFIHYSHMEDPLWRNGGHPRMAILWQDFFDLSITASSHLEKWIRERGARKTATCHINVDTTVWHPDDDTRKAMRAELKIANETPIILHAARICHQKQPDVLLATLAKLEKRKLDFEAIILGEGPDLPRIMEQASKLKLQRIRFLGAKPNNEVKRYMQASDIFFLPSINEGIALSIYESMACGLAVLSANVGGQKELVRPEVGTILNRSTPQEETANYAAILEEWITHPAPLQAMRLAARKRVLQHFHLDAMIQRMIELFEVAKENMVKDPFPPVSDAMQHLFLQDAISWHKSYYKTL